MTGTVVADPVTYPALSAVLDALRTEFAKIPAGPLTGVAAGPGVFTLPGPPAHYRLVPGVEAAFELSNEVDICCEGVAWVRMSSFFHTVEFPSPQPVFEPGGEVSWTVVCEIGVARCSNLMGPDPMDPSRPPDDAQYSFATRVMTNDAAALRRVGPGLILARPDLILDYFYGPGDWQPLAIEGNCMGGTAVLSVQVPAVDAQMAG